VYSSLKFAILHTSTALTFIYGRYEYIVKIFI